MVQQQLQVDTVGLRCMRHAHSKLAKMMVAAPTCRFARLRLSSRCTARASCGLAAASALNLQQDHTHHPTEHYRQQQQE
jgi:hypothetical protein